MDDGGGEVDHRLETAVCLVASHCYAFEFFQFAEEILDQVAPFVNVRVDVERLGAPGILGDYDLRLAFVQVCDDPVGIKSLVGDQTTEFDVFDQGRDPMVSKRWPGSRMNRTRFPSASVSARILVVQPPFDLPMA